MWEKERKGIWWSRVSLQGWMQGTGKEIVRLCILLKKQEKKGNGSWEIFYVELGEMSGSRERIMKYR